MTRAKANPETVKQIAECVHCEATLEKTKDSGGWYHSYTGKKECW